MVFITLMLGLLSIIIWLAKSIALYFALLVSLTVAWNAYKIIWARRINRRSVRSKDAVLISGATSGIGLALAKHLYKLGYSLIIAYYNSKEPGYKELEELRDKSARKFHGQKMIFIELNVRDQESITKAYEKCSKALESNDLMLYALVNNAGLGSLQPFAWLQRTNIVALIQTNLLGSMLMTRQFLPLLIKSRGRILNVSSGLGLIPGPNYATYGVTKSALIYFTRCLNIELDDCYGVKSIAIMPHNYIKNTNICSMNVKNNEAAWDELTKLERELYGKEYSEHCKLAKSLDLASKELAKLAAKGEYSKRITDKKKNAGGLMGFLKELSDTLKGWNESLTLEESGALECFEDALRLEYPPEHIFAGDNIYKLLIGSFLLSMPAPCAKLLGSSVSPSLYR